MTVRVARASVRAIWCCGWPRASPARRARGAASAKRGSPAGGFGRAAFWPTSSCARSTRSSAGLGPRAASPGPFRCSPSRAASGWSTAARRSRCAPLLARESDRGLETLAGEIVGARTIALEVLVTVLDDLALERALDEPTGVWLLVGRRSRDQVAAATAHACRSRPRPAVPSDRGVRSAVAAATSCRSGDRWSGALEASAHTDRDPSTSRALDVDGACPSPAAGASGDRRRRPVPEAGDVVDHFAFGRCDVVKSDGDRLHLRVHKDGRIREIALEMLRVTRSRGRWDGTPVQARA